MLPAVAAWSQDTPDAGNAASAPPLGIGIVYLGKGYSEPEPLSLVDKVVTDHGIQGARIAEEENNRTGRLIGHGYELVETIVPEAEDLAAKAKDLLANGHALVVADLEPDDLLAVADLPEAKDAITFDVRTTEDALRQEKCRANVFHIRPNRAMKAGALAQYLSWKKWRRWFLIAGTKPKVTALPPQSDARQRASAGK